MSAIVMYWNIPGLTISHSSLLLNGLDSQTLLSWPHIPYIRSWLNTYEEKNIYISVYEPHSTQRFNLQSLWKDYSYRRLSGYTIIPTIEDGNSFGLNESSMATFWEQILSLRYRKNFLTKEPNKASRVSDQNTWEAMEANRIEHLQACKTKPLYGNKVARRYELSNKEIANGAISDEKIARNAIGELSSQFRGFIPIRFNCTKFIYHVLVNGGLLHYYRTFRSSSPFYFMRECGYAREKIITANSDHGKSTRIRELILPQLTQEQESEKRCEHMGQRMFYRRC